MRPGCAVLRSSPWDPDDIPTVALHALDFDRLVAENKRLREALEESMWGNNDEDNLTGDD
jgi:hypothetical protein